MHFTPRPRWLRIVSMAIGGLAGLAVADDQLALTAADRGHGVDGLDAGLQRLVHRLATDDAGRLHLEAAQRCCWRSGPCRRWPGRARSRPDRRARRPTGTERIRPVAFTDWPSSISSAWPSTTAADRALVEVQREAEDPALELEQLVDRRVGQTGDAGDAVADLQHPTDLRVVGGRACRSRCAHAVRLRSRRR